MFERLNKISVQVIASIICIIGSFIFLYVLAFKPVPVENEKLIDILGGIVIGTTLTGAIGWLFGQSKQATKQ